jgi:hypothetical protein
MRSQTVNASKNTRIIHHANEKLLATEFLDDDDFDEGTAEASLRKYKKSVPILWADDTEDDALDVSLQFDPVLYAASEWNSNLD